MFRQMPKGSAFLVIYVFSFKCSFRLGNLFSYWYPIALRSPCRYCRWPSSLRTRANSALPTESTRCALTHGQLLNEYPVPQTFDNQQNVGHSALLTNRIRVDFLDLRKVLHKRRLLLQIPGNLHWKSKLRWKFVKWLYSWFHVIS